ncbi:unnamed protein product [Rhizoctonia solani]|uniref:Peptidase A1 domain-containing protein n=1 Tax=Rhizoctonia solani TaxID=456999 RepID=A0A8H3HVA3_9AGAM|nr:unnamed protein product [Rhizoctonia solani]
MIPRDFYPVHGVIHYGPGGFSVHADRNTKYRPNGPSDYAKCIRKYRIGATDHTPFFFDQHRACVCHHKRPEKTNLLQLSNIPGNVRIPSSSIEQDPVNLDPDDGMTVVRANDIQNDTEYACPVTIGTPGVTLTLDFDTGSSDFWVWSSEFRASRAQLEGHQIYNPNKSRTAESLPGAAWKIGYGDGSHASGNVVMDTITIGDITIKRQAIEVAQQLSDEFLRGGSDGLLGLAFPKLNTVQPHQQKTPMQNMVEQGLVKDPIFTVKLDKHDSRGFYTFGYINENVHASKLYWQKVITDNGWWEVVSPYVRIGSKIYNRGHSNTAIIVSSVFQPNFCAVEFVTGKDTGTTLILMDDKTIERLYSQIPGARLDQTMGGYIFPTKSRIPELAFCVGRWLFTVPSSDLAFSDAGHGMSYGAIQSRGQNKQDILGDVFLKHVYAVFDQGNNPRYAKCIKKYKIGATIHTPFFFDEVMACVWHHKHPREANTHSGILGNLAARPADLDSNDRMTVVQAEDIHHDAEYACPVTIGSPGVTLTLDFDTGSSDFWVWSSEFRARRAQLEGHQIYNPHKSQTAERLPGASWNISYGDGSSASGDVVLDMVTIGNITLKRQAVEVAQHLSDEFMKGGSDGLLGLAFPKLNTVKPYQQKTPMQHMVEQGLIKKPVFTVKLDKHDSRGFYTFGYIDEHINASELYWREAIIDNGWWEVTSPYVKIGSEIYDRGHSNTAIIDTGTTLILMDDQTIKRLYSQISGAKLDHSIGGYIFPTDAHLPKLAFSIGKWLFTVPSEDLAFSDAGNGMSYGAIQSRGQNKQDILGDVFLKHVYVVFDQGANPRVGVAQRR